MQNIDKYIEQDEQNGSGMATLMVSLYLVVLAFFILLNSISVKDVQKTQNAINSLTSVFSNQKGNSDLKMESPAIFDFNFIVSNYFDSIEDVIRSVFQVENVTMERSGNSLSITIPINIFFYGDEQGLKKQQREFLDSISSILKEEQYGAQVYFDFKVDSFSYLNNFKEQAENEDVARTSLIIDYLLSKGVPRQLISGGIRFNEKNNVTIDFIVLEAGSIAGGQSGK